MELNRGMDKPVSILFKLVFAGLFIFMVSFIMKLEISDFDSYSYLGKANYNLGFHYYDEPELNTRPPLYPFLLTPVAALQHLDVSPKAVLKSAQFIALLLSFAFIASSYLLLKELLSRELAALGALLMMIQPAFLVFSFEPMVDLPCSLLLVLAMRFYLKYRKNPCRKNLMWVCFLTGVGMIMKYSLVVAPFIFSLAEIVVLRTKEKVRWSSIFQNKFLYMVPLISTGFYMLISLISFSPQYGWTWKNLSMIYAPFFMRINYSILKEFEFDFLANFSFLEIHMTLPWIILMILGLYYCLKHLEWESMVMWSWLVSFMFFITFVSWNYHVQYLFPVMPACYYFSLYGVKDIYGRAQKYMAGKGYFPVLRVFGLVALLAWPTVNLVGEIKSLSGSIYRNKIAAEIVNKVKEISNEKDTVWYLGEYYPIYKFGEQIHPQDWFYKIYHLGANALSFLSARKVRDLPDSTPYIFSNLFNKGSVLIYYPGPGVLSKYIPAPDSLPSILVGNVELSVFTFKSQTETDKSFLNQDGSSEIKLTSIDDNYMAINLIMKENQNIDKFFWFKIDGRIINSEIMERNFFHFQANEEMILHAGRDYFARIREITLLSYKAEEFR